MPARTVASNFRGELMHGWGDRIRPPHFTGIVPHMKRNPAPHRTESRPTSNGMPAAEETRRRNEMMLIGPQKRKKS